MVSVMAMSRRNGAFYVHHTPVQISAESDAEANDLRCGSPGVAIRRRDGWRWHSAEVMRDPGSSSTRPTSRPSSATVPPVDVRALMVWANPYRIKNLWNNRSSRAI
jgi:hypothetical protein